MVKAICKYCGTTYKVQGKNTSVCNNCQQKLPLARKFVEVCDEIKRKVYKEKR